MKRIFSLLGLLFCIILIVGCHKDNLHTANGSKRVWHEHTIAVILPMNSGMNLHWKRTLEWVSRNLESAFVNQEEGVRLRYEWYDENSADLAALAKQLSRRDDIEAVIGGVKSVNAQIMAPIFTKYKKIFFTLATNSNLIRAYSDSTLWAMTESDITLCEILLSKVVSYKGKSVALLVSDDSYGETFVDWFGFQSKEMELINGGIFSYDPTSLQSICEQAAAADVDYVICTPSSTDHIRTMLEAFNKRAAQNLRTPRPLFTDVAYGMNVISEVGNISEGLEGVTYCADPESGFDVSYGVYFNSQPTLGESQVYDAATILGYAMWYQHLNEGISLNEAIKVIVDGKDYHNGGWMPENMRDVIDELTAGKHPDISGACGLLDFDSKVYTNILCTTYCHYKVYNGQYITLDYNTSHGGYRTDSALANWNRLKEHMQEFDYAANKINYPNLEDKWALLVAGSSGWENYRFQADVLAMYQQLKSCGYTDDHIVLIMEDDIAYNSNNPYQGTIQVAIGGDNLYYDVDIDYHLSDLKAEDIKSILLGDKSDRLPEVISSTENDNLFVFWSGHGYQNQLCWDEQFQGLSTKLLRQTFEEMDRRDNFRKQLWFVESCYSGSVLQACEGITGILAFTAADANETSKADIFNGVLGVWMSNQFTYTLRNEIANSPTTNFYNLYHKLFVNTLGSHVMLYNGEHFGNIITNTLEEFL